MACRRLHALQITAPRRPHGRAPLPRFSSLLHRQTVRCVVPSVRTCHAHQHASGSLPQRPSPELLANSGQNVDVEFRRARTRMVAPRDLPARGIPIARREALLVHVQSACHGKSASLAFASLRLEVGSVDLACTASTGETRQEQSFGPKAPGRQLEGCQCHVAALLFVRGLVPLLRASQRFLPGARPNMHERW